MKSFNFFNPTEIIYGNDKIIMIGQKVIEYTKSNNILIVTAKSSKKNGSLDIVKKELKKNGINYYIFNKIISNPTLDYIDEAVELIKGNSIDFIIALGGASVVDTAKTISVAACNEKQIWDLICNPSEITGALPLGVIITLYGSGTEMTNGAVITNTKIPKKRGFDSIYMYPKFSIIDPTFLKTVSKEYLMIGATDMFMHTLEYYFEITNEDNLSDPYFEILAKQMVEEINQFKNDRQDNSKLFWLSTMAQNKFFCFDKNNNGEWIAHIISHEFCMKYNLPHGKVVAVLFLAWLNFIKEINKNRIINFGKKVYNLSNPTVETVIDCIKNTLELLDNKTNLKDLGVQEADLEDLILNSTTGKILGKYKRLSIDDIKKIVYGGFYGF